MEHLFDPQTSLKQNIFVQKTGDSQWAVEGAEAHLLISMQSLILAKEWPSDYIRSIQGITLTPNDTTLYNHIQIPDELAHWWVIGSILQCNNPKVNKSSVLWHHYLDKTRSIYSKLSELASGDCSEMLVMADLDKLTRPFMVARVSEVLSKAVRAHPRNYYACNAIVVFADVFGANRSLFLDQIKSIMVQVDDLSLWLAFTRASDSLENALQWISTEVSKAGVVSCMMSPGLVLEYHNRQSLREETNR